MAIYATPECLRCRHHHHHYHHYYYYYSQLWIQARDANQSSKEKG